MRKKSTKNLGTLLAVLALTALVIGGALSSPALAAGYSSEEIAFVQLINEYRVGRGLQPLLVSDMLSEACDRHNSDMGKYGFFSHQTAKSDWFATGSSPWDRMAASGYDFNTYKGENIAAGYGTAAAVFAGWKSSSGHNANMLSPNFNVLGVSMVYVQGSQYGYYWTTDFGGYVDSSAHAVGSVAPAPTTTIAPTSTTAVQGGSRSFSDVDARTLYAKEILLLADRGVVTGYGDGTFGPTAKVTRQQFAKMVVLALGHQVSPLRACAFKDVTPVPDSADPLYPVGYVAACAAAGITVGKTIDTFCPYEEITRAQLITMVARAAGLSKPPTWYTPAFENFNDSHYPWACCAAYAGLLDGLIDMGPGYQFWASATRGEVCLLLANLMGD